MNALASPNCFSKNVRVLAIIIAELKLGNIEREVLAANFVIGADNTTLHQTPKAFNGVGVDSAANVFLFAVVHGAVRRIFFDGATITRPLIRDKMGMGADVLVQHLL